MGRGRGIRIGMNDVHPSQSLGLVVDGVGRDNMHQGEVGEGKRQGVSLVSGLDDQLVAFAVLDGAKIVHRAVGQGHAFKPQRDMVGVLDARRQEAVEDHGAAQAPVRRVQATRFALDGQNRSQFKPVVWHRFKDHLFPVARLQHQRHPSQPKPRPHSSKLQRVNKNTKFSGWGTWSSRV